MSTRSKLFVSYCHEDIRWLKAIKEQLAVLEREGLVEVFEDSRLRAGEPWFERLHSEMSEARVALLLLSAPFLSSSFVRNEEIPKLFSRHADGGMLIYPLLVRPCPWSQVPWLAKLQLRPQDPKRRAKAVSAFSGAARDQVLADVASEIAVFVKAREEDSPSSTASTSNKTLPQEPSPLVTAAMEELKARGSVSIALCEAMYEEPSSPVGLEAFLLEAVRTTAAATRGAFGQFAVRCVDKFDVGYSAVEYCLEPGNLGSQERGWLGMQMRHVVRPAIVPWAHRLLVRDIKADQYYSSFLLQHRDYVFSHLSAEMTAYLLAPDRGPAHSNLNSIAFVATQFDRPHAFIQRLRDWIYNGLFDKSKANRTRTKQLRTGAVSAAELYKCLNEIAQLKHEHPAQALRKIATDRAKSLLESDDDFLTGLHHLYYMRAEQYVDVDHLASRVYNCPIENELAEDLFDLLKRRVVKIEPLDEVWTLADRLGVR